MSERGRELNEIDEMSRELARQGHDDHGRPLTVKTISRGDVIPWRADMVA
jgi:hypothetical protein